MLTFDQYMQQAPDRYTLDPDPTIVTKVVHDQYGKQYIQYRTMPPGTRAYTCKVYPEHHRNAGRRFIRPTSPLKDYQAVAVVVRVYHDGREETTAFRDFSKALDWFTECNANV